MIGIGINQSRINFIVHGKLSIISGEVGNYSFEVISGNPYDNINLSNVLNLKVNAGIETENGYASKSLISTGNVDFTKSLNIIIELESGNNLIEFTDTLDGLKCGIWLIQPTSGQGYVTWINEIRWCRTMQPILTTIPLGIDIVSILYNPKYGFIGNYSGFY